MLTRFRSETFVFNDLNCLNVLELKRSCSTCPQHFEDPQYAEVCVASR